jgi:hypothetical protein
MTDIYLKASTEEDMNAALVAAGLAHVDSEHGLLPVNGVSLDVIGPITKWAGSIESPIATVYPEWHVNMRCDGLTEEQHSAVLDYVISPPETPYRVWA